MVIKPKIKNLLLIPGILLVGFLISQLFLASINDSVSLKTNNDFKDFSKQHYKIFSPYIPDSLTFCNSIVPLDQTEIKEALDLELLKNTYWHSSTLLVLKKFKRYMAIIDPVLKAYEIPSDIRYLAIAESGLQNVVSPAGARGVWQFMKETAQHYGLTVNNSVDERYDIELATHAACKYLTFLNKKYKDWPLAAAAYNMGQGALDAELKQQQVESYFDLFLNEETSRYVFRILSYKLICEDPMQYGFYLRPDDLYPEIPVDTLRVDTNVTDMVLFAQKQGTTLKMIRNLNPHLRKSAIELKANESIRIFVPSLSQKAKPVQLDSTVFVRNLNE